MDIYRKELEQVYRRQFLEEETLSWSQVQSCAQSMLEMSLLNGMCCVLTDIANDICFVSPALVGNALGLNEKELAFRKLDSSDEDFLYARIHPHDLVDLRMLEYEFFSLMDDKKIEEKMSYKAVANIRMKNSNGEWIWVSKSTQVTKLSPKGKIWLILCTYDILGERINSEPRIINLVSGDIDQLSFDVKKSQLLTIREKEILKFIQQGKLSKEIASILGISSNTVNRHRQNILCKLSVGNSMEAINAAISMNLL